jgi:hypothetical protein
MFRLPIQQRDYLRGFSIHERYAMPTTLIAGMPVSGDHFKRYRLLLLLYLNGFLVFTGIDAIS